LSAKKAGQRLTRMENQKKSWSHYERRDVILDDQAHQEFAPDLVIYQSKTISYDNVSNKLRSTNKSRIARKDKGHAHSFSKYNPLHLRPPCHSIRQF